jgi:threonine/homoserine/homoserine lactone efflux protein
MPWLTLHFGTTGACVVGKAIGEILPYAAGAAISVVPIIAIILMLVTPKAKTNGTSFAVGFVLGLALICVVAVALAGGSDFSSGSGPMKTVSIIKLLLGALLLFAAFRQWRGRPKPGEDPAMPKWLQSIDQFTPARSFGIGVALSAINPKNFAMSLAAGLSIAQAGLSTGQEAGTILIYVLLAGATILGPLVVYLGTGQRAAEILGGWRTWLADNNATVMSVLLLVFAVVLIGKGISGLST